MSDFGIKVSEEGFDAQDAEVDNLLLTTAYPHAKIDTSNQTSFRNYLITFQNDIPNPVGTFPNVYRDTLVHSFEHGYDYTPAYWSLCEVVIPPSGAAYYQRIFQDSGLIGTPVVGSEAYFNVKVDHEKVYFIATKYLNTGIGGTALSIAGAQLRLRLFVFVEHIKQ